jgi:PAS domain S-box-containing protein
LAILTALAGYASWGPLAPASEWVLAVVFAISGALTVLVCAALRTALIGLGAEQEARGRVEGQLLRRGERLRMAQESAGVGIWDWDLVNERAYWSPTIIRNLGLRDDLAAPTGEALLAVCHPDDRERLSQVLRTAGQTGERWEIEHRVIHPDGSTHWVLARGESKLDAEGRPARFLGVNLDITAQHLAEGRVRESEARFRTLADSAPVLMWVTDRDDRREFVNRAYGEFMGLDYDAALSLDWRDRIEPDDLDRLRADEARAEAIGELVVLEARYRRGDGQSRWMRSISRPRLDAHGEKNGFIGIALDITDAKQAEADLKRFNELLEERIASALAERDTAQEALARSHRLEALGQLTGGVAHDFNNLLTVVIGALDMIARRPNDAARRERMLEAALAAAQRGEQLTQQLLAFARRQPLKTERKEVDAVVRESEPLLRRAVGEGLDLTITLGAAGLRSEVDPIQFEAALMNLLVNARDAVGGHGSIVVETRPLRLARDEIPGVAAGDFICVGVHDTGMGMAPETLARAFEPFFTTKPVGKGTGLGLSQVYGFASQSGGGATVESTLGKGSSIRLFLPVAQARAEPEAIDGPREAEATPALDVLLVEDEPAVAELVVELLKDLGHRVRHAPDAWAALDMLALPEPIDLLLTDLVMPGGKSGVELAREAVAHRPGLPVILSSGYSGDTLDAAERDTWPLLRKPYTRDRLAACIRGALGGVDV